MDVLLTQDRSVLAAFCIDALFLQHQPLDRFPPDQMRINDLVKVGGAHPAVPNGLGIYHDIGAVLALVEAAGLVGAKAALQPAGLESFLELLLQLTLSRRIATTAWTGSIALVGANEDMFFKFRHCQHYPRCMTARRCNQKSNQNKWP